MKKRPASIWPSRRRRRRSCSPAAECALRRSLRRRADWRDGCGPRDRGAGRRPCRALTGRRAERRWPSGVPRTAPAHRASCGPIARCGCESCGRRDSCLRPSTPRRHRPPPRRCRASGSRLLDPGWLCRRETPSGCAACARRRPSGAETRPGASAATRCPERVGSDCEQRETRPAGHPRTPGRRRHRPSGRGRAGRPGTPAARPGRGDACGRTHSDHRRAGAKPNVNVMCAGPRPSASPVSAGGAYSPAYPSPRPVPAVMRAAAADQARRSRRRSFCPAAVRSKLAKRRCVCCGVRIPACCSP